MVLVAEPQTLDKGKALKYLQIYNTDMDWEPHINNLYQRLTRKENGTQLFRKQVACTILLPYHDHSVITSPPENLLFWCQKYNQFNTRDWVDELLQAWEKDTKIEEYRNRALGMGIINPIEYVPQARQALRWLMERVEMSGDVAPGTPQYEATRKKMQNLVYAYGGAIICNVIDRQPIRVAKLPNWRTGYFFERLLFDIYKPEEILRIKEYDLRKIDNKLVKKIRTV